MLNSLLSPNTQWVLLSTLILGMAYRHDRLSRLLEAAKFDE